MNILVEKIREFVSNVVRAHNLPVDMVKLHEKLNDVDGITNDLSTAKALGFAHDDIIAIVCAKSGIGSQILTDIELVSARDIIADALNAV